ncbi:Alpha/beta hydrolase [Leifsonia sp. CL147]|nr:Alpha/beta hydrolase [Leifsonia sp. CL154]SFL29036.1 Alpha/beta hydrolase [Leifsonia sp. CL147]
MEMHADPTPGTVEIAHAWMGNLQAHGAWLQQLAGVMDGVLNLVQPPAWTGLAADAFCARLRGVRDAANTSSARNAEAAEACNTWVNAMWSIQFTADNALEAAEEALADIATQEAAAMTLGSKHAALLLAQTTLEKTYSRYADNPPPPGTHIPTGLELQAARRKAETVEDELRQAQRLLEDAQQRLDQARRDAQTAKDEYEHAESTFVTRMDATLNGAPAHATTPELHDFTSGFGKLTTVDKTGVISTPVDAMLLLERLLPAEMNLLLAGDSATEQFWDHPPAPDVVAGWWNSLEPAIRDAFITDAPGIIGNLPGIPYSDRNRANLITLHDAMKNPNLTPEQKAVLKKMELALNPPVRGVPVQVVAFNLYAHPPMVAVGYGDLDTCSDTTWCASGMGFGAKDALDSWSDAAKNLWNAQKKLGEPHPGVVACLEYDNPDLAGVNVSDAAKDGARRFAAELDGDAAVRDVFGPGPAPINVVAHSYGTTMAAIALTLTHIRVDAFVMVGSAGIDTGLVPSLSKLHADHVYTTAASEDLLAPFGAALSGRAEPNPGVARPLDPSIGGATSFSSDGDGDLLRVDGHNPLGEKGHTTHSGFQNAAPSEDHGYFDPRTQSLKNIAATTTGRLDQLSGTLTDTAKAAAEHNKDITEAQQRLNQSLVEGR